ncbi:MAG: prevent-host-death protein [Candidatus Hydrogenedentota bacterium]
MKNLIAANELKTKGVSLLSKVTSDGTEALITVRGKTEFVVLPIKTYNYLRECELEVALLESKNDISKGRFVVESVKQHIKRITRV